MSADSMNGLFEFAGGFMLLLNVFRIHRDKAASGFHPSTAAFFTAWGYWNLYYYPSLGQWFSFACGVFLVTVNTIWLSQIYYYSWRSRAALKGI